ncbi:hypothetical protein MPTK1_6g06250 [Marchantia polymorpha subsp. ruderalis]|uniref:Uncharacterized protein n=2 Tax=Marchantia polymorpha TaxID=3197 RepID=A0AAF6BP47_MARPO|nr:hypothetical protein MARPO_0097s0019 [Marchantia polymorpha]BBN13781.1 hypothetical protein Mp_6g06250 [Marchantia polymorpha subsp. ruderalis]|eukprot:PTQ32533.1 hypothetical protein MARPO_0097s0019 [Marchantia polymorpha]
MTFGCDLPQLCATRGQALRWRIRESSHARRRLWAQKFWSWANLWGPADARTRSAVRDLASLSDIICHACVCILPYTVSASSFPAYVRYGWGQARPGQHGMNLEKGL